MTTTSRSLEEHMAASRTTSPDEIKRRIEEGQERARLRREAQLAANAAAKVVPPHPYAEWDGKIVGFIVQNRKGKFKPFVARPSTFMDDDDALMVTLGSQEAQDTLEQAQACFQRPEDPIVFYKVFQNPVPSGGMFGTWLSELLRANLDA